MKGRSLSGSDNPKTGNWPKPGWKSPQERYQDSLTPEQKERSKQRKKEARDKADKDQKERRRAMLEILKSNDESLKEETLSPFSVDELMELVSGINEITYSRMGAGLGKCQKNPLPDEEIDMLSAMPGKTLYKAQLTIMSVILAKYKRVCSDYNDMLKYT